MTDHGLIRYRDGDTKCYTLMNCISGICSLEANKVRLVKCDCYYYRFNFEYME